MNASDEVNPRLPTGIEEPAPANSPHRLRISSILTLLLLAAIHFAIARAFWRYLPMMGFGFSNVIALFYDSWIVGSYVAIKILCTPVDGYRKSRIVFVLGVMVFSPFVLWLFAVAMWLIVFPPVPMQIGLGS